MTTTAPDATVHGTAAKAAGKYLTFILGRECYGVPVLKVREIIRVCGITPVPQMPDYLRGVLNLRGKVIPVADLRIKFGLPDAANHERTCIVVVSVTLPNRPSSLMGLIVDAVEEVANIAAADIETTDDVGASLDTRYILGMAKVKGRVEMLLDIDRVLAGPAIEAFPTINGAAPDQAIGI